MSLSLFLPFFIHREALLKMRDVYTANTSLGDPNSVNKRLEEIGRKIDNLRLELNTYQVSEQGISVIVKHFQHLQKERGYVVVNQVQGMFAYLSLIL